MTTPSSTPSVPLVDESTTDVPTLTRTTSEPITDLTPTTSEPITEPEPKKKARAPKAKKASDDTDDTNKENEDPDAAEKRPKRAKKDPEQDQPKSKRGHARPHRRLDSETIVARIDKLDRRIQRAQTQLSEATRHAQGYKREMTFRPDEKPKSIEEKLEASIEKGEA